MKTPLKIGERIISDKGPPLIIPEIGINHEGDIGKAKRMIYDAHKAGAECVKFQCHIIEDEMIFNSVIPGNAKESIWDIMKRCSFSEADEIRLKEYAEDLGLIYLSTPFSRAAADRLYSMGVDAFKIGSGECNNYPLIKHIASFGKPIILSTGMNSIGDVKKAVEIIEDADVPYAIMQCTSIYPTPYNLVRLPAIKQLKTEFPNAQIGLSDHSIGNYTCFAAIPFGATILEKHFVSDKSWEGPDVPISINPQELQDLIRGSIAIFEALAGEKQILPGEAPTIAFAYACVVTTSDVKKGELLTEKNTWVKRPGTGKIKARHFESVLGKRASMQIDKDTQLDWDMIED